ncbi:MAG: cation diffusion facilitator family transporter [Caulobacterales bacterium]|nr:cation diffusion facilitator family transporter [Caulobacterales bacterium]
MTDTAPTGPGRMEPGAAARVTGRATAVSVGVALALIGAKAAAFAASGSVAILASLADSTLDLAASLVTFMAVRYAATPADAQHRHGHGKAEALAALIQAVLVAVAATLVARESVMRFLDPQPIDQGGVAIAVMVFSLAVTSGLVWVQTRAVRKTGSVAVEGDRAHYLADVAANVAVLAGVGLAAFAGAPWADPVVGAGVALWLVWSAWGVASGALDQMMDRELSDADRARIAALVTETPGVRHVHGLRTRAAGPLVHIQMHADMDPALTLEAAHRILVRAERAILEAYPGADVLIHPDPEGRAEPHGNPHLRDPEEDAHAV